MLQQCYTPLASSRALLYRFRFLAPLSVQVLLLHPVFPATLSRSLRLALTPVSLYYCWHATKYGFEPLSSSVGLNFVLGVMESYGMWKAIEWGTAVDLTRYTFVGFDETDDGKAVSSRKDKAELHKIRAKQAEGDSPVDILRWTGLLLISMRGELSHRRAALSKLTCLCDKVSAGRMVRRPR